MTSTSRDAPVLSLVMPVHNEARTLPEILKRLGAVDFPCPWELIIVDDGSTDGSLEVVDRQWVADAQRVLAVRTPENRGKGAALRKGFSLAEGDVLGVQDADLEYSPDQIPALVAPILDGRFDVVFGTREFGAHASYSFWYVMGNRLISFFASAMFNRYITDAYTCYKFFSRKLYEQVTLTADGFDIEAELVGELLATGTTVYELPIDYQARTREQGKKIRPADGLKGLGMLVRVRLRGW